MSGYNYSAQIIRETPDAIHYNSDAFIARKYFVWIQSLKGFLPISHVSMYLHCILIRENNYYIIMNNFGDVLAKSLSKIHVNEDGYILVKDSEEHTLEDCEGKNLYEEQNWYLLPYMGGRIEIPFSLIKETQYLKGKSGKTIIELSDTVRVKIFSNGVVINNKGRYSYIATNSGNPETIFSDADNIIVYLDHTIFVKKGDFFTEMRVP